MLNENQKLAVNHINGPCLVIAGPGSGKTTVLVNRISNLIKNHINPSSILVITFTKDAANEMKLRFQKKEGELAVNFGTFHSIFYKFLKSHYRFKDFEIITEKQKYVLINEILTILNIEYLDNEFIYSIISTISMFYNNNGKINFEEIPIDKDTLFKIIDHYEYKKTKNKLIDFDDMLTLTKKLLNDDEVYLKKLSGKYEYILIDEFQDINPIQYDVIKLLLKNKPNDKKNIFVVGDDDQSIYGFRGSNPKIMLGFMNEFDNAKKIVLECNYRSSKKIVSVSKDLIKHNENRFFKDYKAFNNEEGFIKIIKVENEIEEVNNILKIINDKKETAILYRNRSNATLVVYSLKSKNIDFFTDEDINIFKDKEVVKDIISFFRIIVDNYTRKDIIRIINKPEKHILREGLSKENIKLKEYLNYYNKNSYPYKKIKEFIIDIDNLQVLSPYLCINYVLKSIGYEKYINDFSYNQKIQKQNVITLISNISKKYINKKEFLEFLEKEIENSHKRIKRNNENILLYTFHGSKGLEFERVIILDAVEGITPSKNAKTTDFIEEERRMFYVAMTRAKKELIIYVPNRIHNEQMYISRFVSEISM